MTILMSDNKDTDDDDDLPTQGGGLPVGAAADGRERPVRLLGGHHEDLGYQLER